MMFRRRRVAGAALPERGINVPPSMRPWRNPAIVNPDSWWDPEQGPAFIAHEMPLLQELGPATVRVEFPWWAIERDRKGHADWSRADRIVEAAAAHLVQLAPVLVWTPAWAAPGCVNMPTSCVTSALAATCPATPPSAEDFGDFVHAVVSRYGGRVTCWEMWNEPDLPKYFNGSAADYARRVLVPGYRGAKAAAPDCLVIFGGPHVPDVGWIRAVLDAGGEGHFDVMAFHGYGDARAVLRGASSVAPLAGGKPLWLGEWGVQDRRGVKQVRLIEAVLGTASELHQAQWYALRDDRAMSGRGEVCVESWWGLVTATYRRKPSFAVFQAWPD